MDECFYLSNMAPQHGSMNSGMWNRLEASPRLGQRTNRNVLISRPRKQELLLGRDQPLVLIQLGPYGRLGCSSLYD